MEGPHRGEAHRRPNKTKAHRILTYQQENLGGEQISYIRKQPRNLEKAKPKATILEPFCRKHKIN